MEKFSATTTEVDNYLELLDKASFDPAIKKVVEEAKIYNELLATTTLSPDELNKDLEDMVVELNSQWGAMINSEVRVSGLLKRQDAVDEDDKYSDTIEHEPQYADQQILRFMGIACTETTPLELVYLFDSEDSEDDYVWSARLDSAYFEFVHGMSFERAIAYLELNSPELFEDIECQLLNTDGLDGLNDELMALRRLGEIHFNLPEDVNETTFINAVNNYINRTINPDGIVPYIISASGDIRLRNDDGEYVQPYNKDIHNAIAISPTFHAKKLGDEYGFIIDTIVNESTVRTTIGDQVQIPLSDLTQFVSLREFVLAD